MRQIGTIPNLAWAERFTAFLITQGIIAQAEEEGGAWAIWVRDEDHLDEAKAAFEQFKANPEDPQYQDALREATAILAAETKRREEAQKNVIEMRGRWRRPGARRNPLVVSVILLCIGVYFLSLTQASRWQADSTTLTMRTLSFRDTHPLARGVESWSDRLSDIKRGQLWRLVTPAFLHASILHLAFNMFMFHMFGSVIEDRRGTAKLALIVVFIAAVSNSAQGLAPSNWGVFGGSPYFLGLSGVVYGLLGYLWMKTTYEPDSGLYVSGGTVAFLLIWMFLGFAGVLKPMGIHMANLAHGVGFVTGLAIGYWPQFLRRWTP